MKSTELRIGNYIEKNGCIATVEIINGEVDEIFFLGEDFYYSDHAKDIDPILLNEEWLVKFGFKKMYEENKDGRILRDDWFFKVDDFLCISIESDFSLAICSDEHFSDTVAPSTYIKYVHQLQNLYHALCGEELTIKETVK